MKGYLRTFASAVMVFGVAMLGTVAAPIGAGAVSASSSTVYRFAGEPFNYSQYYSTSDYFPGPAATFGQDVNVTYVAQNSETVRYENGAVPGCTSNCSGNVEWSLIQVGTATVYSLSGDVLYSGPFTVEEHARDLGNNAGCTTSDGHAWLGHCTSAYSNLDWLNYNWQIAGASVYFFNLSISSPGMYCFSSKQGGSFGPGC